MLSDGVQVVAGFPIVGPHISLAVHLERREEDEADEPPEEVDPKAKHKEDKKEAKGKKGAVEVEAPPLPELPVRRLWPASYFDG